MSGWIVSAAAFSSSARRPCVTIRTPITGGPRGGRRRPPRVEIVSSLAGGVAVRHADRKPAPLQSLSELIGHVDRAVLSTGAADSDRQVALVLALVERQQVIE